MTTCVRRLLFWTPRILGILFAAFISLFALDVFEEGRGLRETIPALLLHLIPTGIVIIALAIAWRREWVGGILFLGLGGWYLLTTWGRFHWSTYVAIAGPLFVVGVLFLVDLLYRTKVRDS